MSDIEEIVNDSLASLEVAYTEFLTKEGFTDIPMVRIAFVKAAMNQLREGRDELPSEVYELMYSKLRVILKSQYKIVVDNIISLHK